MSDLKIYNTEKVVPIPFVEITFEDRHTHRVFDNGTVVKHEYDENYQVCKWVRVDENEPDYKEIQEIGLQILNG